MSLSEFADVRHMFGACPREARCSSGNYIHKEDRYRISAYNKVGSPAPVLSCPCSPLRFRSVCWKTRVPESIFVMEFVTKIPKLQL